MSYDGPYHLFNTAMISGVSMGADITSSSYLIKETARFSIHAVWSGGGTPVGTLDLKGSNDGTNFTSVLSTPAAVSGNSGQIMMNVENPAYDYIQVVYTRTSGTGTLTVRASGKRG